MNKRDVISPITVSPGVAVLVPICTTHNVDHRRATGHPTHLQTTSYPFSTLPHSLEISSRLSSRKLSASKWAAFFPVKIWVPSFKRAALGACCWSSFRAFVRFQSFCVSFSMLSEPVFSCHDLRSSLFFSSSKAALALL